MASSCLKCSSGFEADERATMDLTASEISRIRRFFGMSLSAEARVRRWRQAPFLLIPLALVLFGAGLWWGLSTLSSPEEPSIVLKVCRDGTLVLRREDGEFRVVRPGALRGWHAASDKVCEP